MAAETISLSQQESIKKCFLLFRWLLIIVCSLMIVTTEKLLVDATWAYLLVSLLILSNVILYLMPEVSFLRQALYSTVGIGDIFLITLALLISGQTASDFYLMYFLVIIIAALSRDLVRIVISTTVVIIVYGFLLLLAAYESGLPDSSILLRLPFFWVVALFYGYLVQLVRSEAVAKEEILGLHQESKTREQTQRILKELSQSLTAVNVEELFKKLTEGVRDILRVDFADVRLIEKEGSRIIGISGVDREAYRQPRGKRDRWREFVVNPKVLSISDISKDPDAPVGETTRRMSVRGLLRVPFFSRQGQVMGLLRVMSLRPREFTQEEIDQLQQLAHGAAVAVENARLFEEVREKSQELEETNSRLNRLLEEQSALREILTQVNILNMHQLLQKIAQQSLQLLRVDHVHLRLLTPDGFLQPVAAAGSQAQRFMDRLVKVGARTGWIMENLRPLVIADVTQNKEFGPGHIMREEGVKSYLGLPLISRGQKAMGVLIAQSQIQRDFAPEEIALAQQFATGAAIALENAGLFEEVRKKTKELEEAYEAKSDFLNTMAHELRTPLNVIIGNTQLLQDGYYGTVSEAIRKGLETTGKNAHSLVKLINEILDLARLEARRVPLRTEPFSLREFMDELESFCSPLVREKAIRLRFETEDSRLELRSDRAKVKAILQNLIANAVKYTDQGEIRIVVRMEAERDFVSFSVRDTGIGIKSEDLQRVFEPFHMVEGLDRDKYPGSGLGLSLVQRLVQVLQGEIKVESEPGKGSNFTVFLPRIHPENA